MVVYAPNSFTPNGDFLNDVFEVVSTDVAPSTSHLQIFNRWGVMIHESRGDNPTWDGLINGDEAPNDVYLWKYEARLNCGYTEFEHLGHLTLVR
jgi:gliding motility-associated-like protein